MTPPVYAFPVSELPEKIQEDTRGKRRKVDGGRKNQKMDLSACELFTMSQYKCDVVNRNQRDDRIICYAVERFFRKCKDKKGTFTVETTAWQGPECQAPSSNNTIKSAPPSTEEPPKPSKPLQWSTNWNDDDSPL